MKVIQRDDLVFDMVGLTALQFATIVALLGGMSEKKSGIPYEEWRKMKQLACVHGLPYTSYRVEEVS